MGEVRGCRSAGCRDERMKAFSPVFRVWGSGGCGVWGATRLVWLFRRVGDVRARPALVLSRSSRRSLTNPATLLGPFFAASRVCVVGEQLRGALPSREGVIANPDGEGLSGTSRSGLELVSERPFVLDGAKTRIFSVSDQRTASCSHF